MLRLRATASPRPGRRDMQVWNLPRSSVLPLRFSFAGRHPQPAAHPPIVPSGVVARKINRETVVLLGWGRAILLQLAHPLVAAGVADYSRFQTDLRGYAARTTRTVGAMLALTFGSEEEMRAIASQINAIHNRIRGTLREAAGVFPAGTPYSARDPELLRWVHATMVDSLPLAYELFVGPLTPDEKDRYCAEAAMIAPLLGIPDGLLPCGLAEHESYMEQMFVNGQIEVTENARRRARSLLSPPLGPAAAPLFSVVRRSTIGLLPSAIRQSYGFPWDAHDDDALGRFVTFVRQVRWWLPRMLREWPAARLAV
jgi:uncharacterized protein (DUF2236 family)